MVRVSVQKKWNFGAKGPRSTGSRIKHGISNFKNLDVVPKERLAENKLSDDKSVEKTSRYGALARENFQSCPDVGSYVGASQFINKTKSSCAQNQEMCSCGVFGSWDEYLFVKAALFAAYGKTSLKTISVLRERAFGASKAHKGDDTGTGLLKKGLQCIGVWRCRARPGLSRDVVPRYVEATAIVAEAILFDKLWTLGQSGGKDTAALEAVPATAVASTYGGALSRALHEMTEGLTSTNSYVTDETTYRSRAQSIGLPEEVVELRRRVAHGSSMPLLSEFRIGTALLMEHFYRVYWELQEKNIKEILKQTKSDEKVLKKRTEKQSKVNYSPTVDDIKNLLDSTDEDSSSEEEKVVGAKRMRIEFIE